MCSRYSLTSPHEAVRAYFRYQNEHVFPPRYNIAPTQPAGIVSLDANGTRIFDLVRWGLLPPWVKDPGTFAALVNARAETVHEKPSFKAALRIDDAWCRPTDFMNGPAALGPSVRI